MGIPKKGVSKSKRGDQTPFQTVIMSRKNAKNDSLKRLGVLARNTKKLTLQVSNMVENKLPYTFEDPGCRPILVGIVFSHRGSI